MPALRGPSMGLLVLAGMQSFNAVLSLPVVIIEYFAGGQPLQMALVTLVSLPSIVIFIGALRMRQMRSLRFCRVAAIMACIPIITPTVVVGIPLGIWATLVLFKPNTAAAFEQPAQDVPTTNRGRSKGRRLFERLR